MNAYASFVSFFLSPQDSEPLGVLKLNNCCASLNIPDESDNSSLYKLTISLNQMKDSCNDTGLSVSNLIPLQVLAAKSADLALKWVTAINDASNQLSRVTLSSSSYTFCLPLSHAPVFRVILHFHSLSFFLAILVGKVKAFTIYDARVHFHERRRRHKKLYSRGDAPKSDV